MPLMEKLLKTAHVEVWLMRKRGSNLMRVHVGTVSWAEDAYRWGDKLYPLKSTEIITYTVRGNQRDILMFDADNMHPLHIFEVQPNDKVLYKDALKIGISTSSEALKSHEATEMIRRANRITMFLAAALAVSLCVVAFLTMYSLGFFGAIKGATGGGTITPPRVLLMIKEWIWR